MKLKHEIESLNILNIMDCGKDYKLHTIIYFAQKVNSSGILACSLSWSFFLCWGSYFSSFLTFLFFLSFDYSFRTYPLYIFNFLNMEKIFRKQRYVHITGLISAIQKLRLLLV